MVPEIVDYALVVAYLLLIGVFAVRYRRGAVSERKSRLYVGMCLTWLAYGLLQVTQDGPVPTGTTLNYALDAVALLSLVVGIWLLYRAWRDGDERTESAAPSG
jgi:protein-S-isoprenylcysteine O-methyltransferase Ste14